MSQKGIEIMENGEWVPAIQFTGDELDAQEKGRMEMLRVIIKQAEGIVETAQAEYVKLAGCRCF